MKWSPFFYAQAGERAEEQSVESFQNIILSRTHQPVPIIVQLFFLCINFQGSLGGYLRRGQHVAQAEVAQMCGGGRDADRMGTSHIDSHSTHHQVCRQQSSSFYKMLLLKKTTLFGSFF